MSRKTKAELEAENKALRRQVEIQAEQISDLLDGAEWDQYKLKIIGDANDAAIDETIRLHEEKPSIIKAARSENARKAAKKRHAIPLLTETELKKEFKRRQHEGPDKAKTTIYKDMAEAYASGRKSWRKIRTRVEK